MTRRHSDMTDKVGQEDNVTPNVTLILQTIVQDDTAPAATRAQAARTLAEMQGLIGRHSKPQDDAAEIAPAKLSRDQLRAELARLAKLTA